MKARVYGVDAPWLGDVQPYCNSWIAWWTSCQPSWRQNGEWPLLRGDPGTFNWIKFGGRGQCGLFLAVVSTAWWAASIQLEGDWAQFDTAVDDIKWVVGKVLESYEALPAPAPPPPPKAPEPPLGLNWMARAGGKRKTKPSRKVLEGGGK
jgi:hypothetical protein